jgi:hypothetical protein
VHQVGFTLGGNGDLRASAVLYSVGWIFTDSSHNAFLDILILEDGTDTLTRNFGEKSATNRNENSLS